MTPSIEPTVDDLRSWLEREELNLEAARIGIDNEQRRQIEMTRIRQRIDALKARIAQAEANNAD